jgi:hypothetical protein
VNNNEQIRLHDALTGVDKFCYIGSNIIESSTAQINSAQLHFIILNQFVAFHTCPEKVCCALCYFDINLKFAISSKFAKVSHRGS